MLRKKMFQIGSETIEVSVRFLDNNTTQIVIGDGNTTDPFICTPEELQAIYEFVNSAQQFQPGDIVEYTGEDPVYAGKIFAVSSVSSIRGVWVVYNYYLANYPNPKYSLPAKDLKPLWSPSQEVTQPERNDDKTEPKFNIGDRVRYTWDNETVGVIQNKAYHEQLGATPAYWAYQTTDGTWFKEDSLVPVVIPVDPQGNPQKPFGPIPPKFKKEDKVFWLGNPYTVQGSAQRSVGGGFANYQWCCLLNNGQWVPEKDLEPAP